MVAREITIHVGLPKTATTTIQRHLFRNSQHLLDLGVDYCPDLCSLGKFPKAPAHHAIARAYMIPKGSSAPPESRDVIQRRLAAPGRYFLSSEVFSRGNTQTVQRFVDECDLPRRRRIVVTTRSELSYIRSHWMQSIKVGKGCDSLWEHYLLRYKPTRKSYVKKLQGWVDAGFSVVALRYEELLASPDATKALLKSALDQEVDSLQWQTLRNANVSPHHDAVAHYQSWLKPLHKIIAPRVNQRNAAKWYKGVHDVVCNSPLIHKLGENRAYRGDVEKIIEDLASLASIDDLSYSRVLV